MRPCPARSASGILLVIVALGMTMRIAACFVPEFGDEATIVKNIARFQRDRTLLPEDMTYPTLYSYLGAGVLGVYGLALVVVGKAHTLAGAGLLFITGEAPLLLPLRLLTVIFDAGCIVAAYCLARRLRDASAGLVAALFVVFSQNHLGYARWGLPDVPMAFFATVSLIFALMLLAEPDVRWYLWAGALAGLAATTKYNGATVIVAIVTAHFLAPHGGTGLWCWRSLRKLLVAGAACITAFCVGSPMWLLQPGEAARAFSGVVEHMETGHYFVVGGTPYLWIARYLWHVETTIGILAGVGLVYALARPRRMGLVVAVFILATVGIVGQWQKQSAYYLLGVWPAALSLAAVALRDLAGRWPRWRTALALLALAAVLWPAKRAVIFVREELREDNRLPAERWIQTNIQPGERIATDWGNLPALYDLSWLREATERRRQQFAHNPDYAIWEHFIARTRVFELEPIRYEQSWLETTCAKYVITASDCYARFFENEPPPAGHSFREGFLARRQFYEQLLADNPTSRFRVRKRFSGGRGPVIVILEAQDVRVVPTQVDDHGGNRASESR